MSDLRKTTPDDIYFVTLTLVGWVDLFSRADYKHIIVNSLKYCQEKEGLEIYCYVIMTNHFHLICRRKNADLNELLGRFKSYTSKEFIKIIENNPQESRKEWLISLFKKFASTNKQYSKYHLWDYTNFPVLIYSNDFLEQKINYIHQNPVKAEVVSDDFMYLYSSACPDSPLKIQGL